MLKLLLLECLQGALAGYITNEYAIAHLFKDFGPIKSVISREQDKLADSLADMVEVKILRGESLRTALDSEKTAEHISDMLVCALTGCSEARLGSLPGFASLAENAAKSAERNIPTALNSFWSAAFEHISLSDIIPPEETSAVLKRLGETDINKAMADIIREKPDMTLRELLPNTGAERLCARIASLMRANGETPEAELI